MVEERPLQDRESGVGPIGFCNDKMKWRGRTPSAEQPLPEVSRKPTKIIRSFREFLDKGESRRFHAG